MGLKPKVMKAFVSDFFRESVPFQRFAAATKTTAKYILKNKRAKRALQRYFLR